MEHYGLQTAAGHLTVPAESKEPYAADVEAGFRADAAQIIARYPQKRSALLPMLHLVQSVDGYITGRGIDLCAELLDLSTAEVSGVATFYTQYKRHPNGRYTVGVCTNTLCAVMGGDAIWEAVSEHLGIGHDETTDDGLITLERIECNAACDFAPVVMTNWEFFDNQTPDSTIKLVDDLRSGQDVRPTRGPDKVVSFQEMSRVLAGFPDGRADQGPGAAGASLAGLAVAHERGWSAPGGAAAAAEKGRAIHFLLETNPGPGLGMLLAYWAVGKGMLKDTAPGAAIIHFLGGIHEIYFPYVLAHPIMILAMYAGGIVADTWFVLFDAGLVATPSPGSIFAYLAVIPRGFHFQVLGGVFLGAVASFLVGSLILRRFPVKEEEEEAEEEEMASIPGLA